MAKIIGNTTTTPMAMPDWNQTDNTKADYIKNKPTVLTEEDIIVLISENGGITDGAGGVGKSTSQGGEIFNDYYLNEATAPYSHAEGQETKARG